MKKKRKQKPISKIELSGEIMSLVINNGVEIYPYYNERTDKWFIQINNNGKKQTSKNSFASGKKISSKDYGEPLEKAYKFYYEKIKQKLDK